MSISNWTTTAACFFFLLTASAQIDFQGGLTFGPTTSQIHGDAFAGYHKLGLSGGGMVDLGFSDKGSVVLELLYTQKGSRNKPDLLGGGDNVNVVKFKLDYIELPVSYRHAPNDKWSVHAGLYYGIFVSGFQENNDQKRDLPESLQGGDIGFQAGAQLDFENSFLRIRSANSIIPLSSNGNLNLNGQTWNRGGYNIVLYLHYGLQF